METNWYLAAMHEYLDDSALYFHSSIHNFMSSSLYDAVAYSTVSATWLWCLYTSLMRVLRG